MSLNWLYRRLAVANPKTKPVEKPQAKIPVPLPVGYTVEKFRANIALREELANFLLRSGTGRHFMTALHNSIPMGYPMRGQSCTDTQASIELGRIQGHLDLMATIYALTQELPSSEDIPQTYGEEEILKKEHGL